MKVYSHLCKLLRSNISCRTLMFKKDLNSYEIKGKIKAMMS